MHDGGTDIQVNCLFLFSDFKQNLYQSIKPSTIPTQKKFSENPFSGFKLCACGQVDRKEGNRLIILIINF